MANEKLTLVDELKSLLEQNVTEVKDQVDKIKNQFYRLYNHEEDADLEAQFKAMLADYKAKRAEALQAVEAEQAQNLLRKENIIAQMKEIAEAETADVMDNLKKVRDLQAEWKTIGAVPAPKTQEINKQYGLYLEKFYDLVKINIELRDLDFKKNLEMKTLLCEAAEKLAQNESIVEASRALQQLHDEWAEIGPVARELREDLWNRFKEASTIINKKHQAYFDELHAKEQENLEKKQAIIAKLKEISTEGLKNSKQWDEATEKITALQAEWRSIGFAPKKYNQTVYEEFRKVCDEFFQKKTAYFKTLRDELGDNLKKKRDIIERAEALKNSTEWQATTEALIALQNEWKTIGPVARKYSDELWKKFTETCDEFFNAKREAGKAQREAAQQRRQADRERYQKRLEGMGDRQKLVRMYENLMQEIKTAENNILFFTAKSKGANKLVADMQKKIDTLKTQLQDLENKINAMDAQAED